MLKKRKHEMKLGHQQIQIFGTTTTQQCEQREQREQLKHSKQKTERTCSVLERAMVPRIDPGELGCRASRAVWFGRLDVWTVHQTLMGCFERPCVQCAR